MCYFATRIKIGKRYMNCISKRVDALSESSTMAMNQKTKDLQAQGVKVVNLSVGEPDFFTPDHIKEAAVKAIGDNYSFYSPTPGFREICFLSFAKSQILLAVIIFSGVYTSQN